MSNDYRGQANLPRGIRNNNPGNINSADAWQGKVGNDPQGFVIFSDMSWGVRAILKSLANMINGGNDTIATLIPTWSLTDQAAYVQNVSAFTGIDPNTQLGTDPDTLGSIMQAIINQENGTSAGDVTAQDISDGWSKYNGTITTAVQAVAVDAISNPIPYLIGGIVLVLGLGFLVNSKGNYR